MARDLSVCGGVEPRVSHEHRDDIDALRAVAVGLVILFHYGVPGFSGGFAGVDIFFVISGFLIGGIIDRELAGGRFTFINFYERRVRRIFPALFTMLFASVALAGVLLFPPDFVRFAESALATALFWSNIHFNAVSGYWDVAAHSKPLLHTWSLAVEEQFYLVFPLMLFAIRKWARPRRLIVLAVLFVASFAASVWAVKASPTAAFYLAPYRFWEFLCGAILAIAPMPKADKRVGAVLAAAGLAMIAYAAVTLHEGANFPGFGAVLPCLGATLLIAAGPDNAVSRRLSAKPMVFVGLISYSLYLWHWPVWVFANTWLGHAPDSWEAAACVLTTIGLSLLSWKYIEQPFRNRQTVNRKPLFVMGGAAMAFACAFGLVVVQTNGLPQRYGPQVAKIMAQETPRTAAQARCFGVAPNNVSVRRLCGIGSNGKPATFILWGDSHAEAILPAVADIAKRNHRRGLFAGSPSCAPLVGVDRYDAKDCRAFNDRVLQMILRHKEITTVILMARWGKIAQGTAYGDEGNGFVPIGDEHGRAQKPSDNAPIFARGLTRTIEALRADGRQVVLVGPVPEIGFTVPQVLARLALAHKEHTVVAPPAEKFYAREADVLPLFRELAAMKGVSAVFPHDYLCQSGRCAVRNDGIPLYKDEHHLSDYGAKKLEPLLGRTIAPLFEKVS